MCPVRNVTYVSGRSITKYAAIRTSPFQGTCHQKTVLPKNLPKVRVGHRPRNPERPMRDPHETSKVGYGNMANLFDPSLDAHFEGM
jgi:hypothetical protein